MEALSWSEETVNQLDDIFVQVSLEDFKVLIPGRALDDKQWKKLTPRSFRGVSLKNLQDDSEFSEYSPLAST